MISAVMVSYRTGPILFRAIEALSAAGVGEIVLVDNGNPPEVERALDALIGRLGGRVLRGHGNVGYGAGCNLGARAARGEVLVFVNPDLAVAPEAPARLAATLSERGGPAVVGGRALSCDGREQKGARRALYTPVNSLIAAVGGGRLPGDPHHHTRPTPPGPIEVGAISGCLFAMRRADFLALGGFDEGFFLHVEDVDLCRRAWAAGGPVVFEPRATGVHARSTSDAPRALVQRAKAESFRRYFRKYARGLGERLAGEAAAAIIAIGLAARARLDSRLGLGRRSPPQAPGS